MAIVVGLGVVPVAVLFAADFVEDAFGTPLGSPRDLVVVIPLLLIGFWIGLPAALAAIAYRTQVIGAAMAVALALVAPACVLYSAREVAHNPEGSFIRLEYIFNPFGPNVVCAGIVGAVALARARRRAVEERQL